MQASPSSCSMRGISSAGPIHRSALIPTVGGMENLINLLAEASRVSTIVFGAMVITAVALASISFYRRHIRRTA